MVTMYVYIHFYKTQKKKKQNKTKPDISREQHSKQVNIRQRKLWKVTQKVKFADQFIKKGFSNLRYK